MATNIFELQRSSDEDLLEGVFTAYKAAALAWEQRPSAEAWEKLRAAHFRWQLAYHCEERRSQP